MFCNSCGAPNPETASFCSRCGKPVVRPQSNLSTQQHAAPNDAPSSPIPQQAGTKAGTVAASLEKQRTFTGHTLPIYSLAFSPDGRWLSSGSLDRTAKLWDVASGRELRTFNSDLQFTCVQFSPDGRRLALGATNGLPLAEAKSIANAIMLWDSATPNEMRSLVGHEGQVFFLKFSPDGSLLASTDGAKTISLWDTTSGHIVKNFRHNWLRAKFLGGTVGASLAFSPDGHFLASRSWPVTLWDVTGGREARNFGPEQNKSNYVAMFLGFTPDGRFLIEAKGSGKITIWDVSSGEQSCCLADPAKRTGVTSVLRCGALDPDGTRLAVATYSSEDQPTDRISLWDIGNRQVVGTITCNDPCYAMAFSPDGKWLAVGDMQYGGGAATGKIRLSPTTDMR